MAWHSNSSGQSFPSPLTPIPYPHRHVKDASLIFSLSVFLLVKSNVPLPMSYDRVLPPLPAFRAPVVTAPSTLGSHSLRHHKIMTIQSSDAITERTRSPASSQKRSSPTQAKSSASPEEGSPEDYEDSPMLQSRRSSQASNGESQQVEKSLPSVSKVSWQEESPSQICLCQPDPKVPRPRNGMSACDSYQSHYPRQRVFVHVNRETFLCSSGDNASN